MADKTSQREFSFYILFVTKSLYNTGYFCVHDNSFFQYKSKFERHLASEKHKSNVYMLEDTDVEGEQHFNQQEEDIDWEQLDYTMSDDEVDESGGVSFSV